MEERLNERFKTKTKEGRETANYQHALRFLKLLRGHADGVTNKKEFTSEYLDKYFCSNVTRNKVLKVLKEEGIIEVTKSYITGIKGKEYRLHNDYLPEELKSNYMINPLNLNDVLSNPNGSVNEDVFFNATPGPEGYKEMFGEDVVEPPVLEKEYTFLYKGFKEVTETITIGDKEMVKSIKESLGDSFLESLFTEECLKVGISQEKAWFFFNKLLNK